MKHDAEAFSPDWAAPPGFTIARMMASQQLSVETLAAQIDLSPISVRSLLDGAISIDQELATRLSNTLGATEGFWLRREANYRSDVARLEAPKRNALDASWARLFPRADMRRFGWIGGGQDQRSCLGELKRFFAVDTTDEWSARYAQVSSLVAFRTSASFESDTYSVVAWLRWAEMQARNIDCADWNRERLLALVPEIRKLTRRKDPQKFLPELTSLCAQAGVAVVIAPTPKGCRASGATRLISKTRAMIVLSFRYKSDDHFWFTLFHEIGHLVLHNAFDTFLEDGSDVTSSEEVEANEFSRRILIPKEYEEEVAKLRTSSDHILRLAARLGISPGIVVGQLQYDGRLGHNQMNHLKRRYKWSVEESASL